MKKDNILFQKRNERINKDYRRLSKKQPHSTVIELLSQKYFLKPRTIFAVVSGEYTKRYSVKTKNQKHDPI